MNDNNKKKLLNFDPLASAEKMTGKNYKNNESVGLLGLVLARNKNQVLTEMLKSDNDTTFSMKMDDYLKNLIDFGFEIVYENFFITGEQSEVHCVLFHKKYSLLLNTDSCGEFCNSATCYFNYKMNNHSEYGKVSHVGLSGTIGGILENVDAREAFRFKISSCVNNGTFLKKWKKRPFLWLLNHGDTKSEGYDYDQINQKVISQLPVHIQVAISPNN